MIPILFEYVLLLSFPLVFSKVCVFPNYLKFGVASSAYQIEGGWNASGKGENIWDYYTHMEPFEIVNGTNGDVAADSYHLWREDVENLKLLGVEAYRFSISWSRILPTGFSNEINPDGVRYYKNLILELRRNDIEPVVTIFHWDLPKPLQDLGGMTNLKIAEYFKDYARIAFELFGDMVKYWITFNEPRNLCKLGYAQGKLAPGIYSPSIGSYLCGKTVLVGHSMAYKLYQQKYEKNQKGKIGISINFEWLYPKTNCTVDKEAQQRAIDFNIGWFLDPIFSKTGNYPEVMIERIAYVSKAQNFSESRLPPLSESEIDTIKGSADFLGLNYYSSATVEENFSQPSNPPSSIQDMGVNIGASHIDAKGFKEALNYIKLKYNVSIFVTENGYADKGELQDKLRIKFLKDHLKELCTAVKSGINVLGYMYWGFMDDFEWNQGYKLKFGLIRVDFNSPNRTRTHKESAKVYTEVIKTKAIP